MKIKVDMTTLASFFLLIWCLELVFPPLTVITPASVVGFICGVAWIVLTFSDNSHFYLRKKNNYFFLPFLFFILTIFISYFFDNRIVAHRYMSMMMLPFGPMIYGYYKFRNRLSNLKVVLFIAAIFAGITFIRTFFALLNNPYIVRSINSSGEYSANLLAQGIGAYGFIYMMVGIAILLLYMAINCTNKVKKITWFILYVLVLLFVVKSNYLTALLVVVVCSMVLMISFVSIGSKNNLQKLILQIFAIFIAFLLMLNIDKVLTLLVPILPNRSASVIRLNANLLNSISSEFLIDRVPTLQESINTFLQHPIFGGIGSGVIVKSGEYLTNVGQHSYILDTFAFFGLIIGIINILVVWIPFSMQKKNGGNKALRISMMICMISIYLFNNATESVALIFGIIYPFVDDSNS